MRGGLLGEPAGFGRVAAAGGDLRGEEVGRTAGGGVVHRTPDRRERLVGPSPGEEEPGQPHPGPGMVGGRREERVVVDPGLLGTAQGDEPLRPQQPRPDRRGVAADRLLHQLGGLLRGDMRPRHGGEEGPPPAAVVERRRPTETRSPLRRIRLGVEDQPEIPPGVG